MSWLAIYVMQCLGINKESTPLESDPEECLQASQLRFGDRADDKNNVAKYRVPSTSRTRLNLSRLKEGSSTIQKNVVDSSDLHTSKNNPSDVQMGMLKESLLRCFDQKWEKVEQNIATQFRKINERNRAQCKETERQVEKDLKELKETIKLQHRETRKRLERHGK